MLPYITVRFFARSEQLLNVKTITRDKVQYFVTAEVFDYFHFRRMPSREYKNECIKCALNRCTSNAFCGLLRI